MGQVAAPLDHAAPVAVEQCRPRTGGPLPMKILDPPLSLSKTDSMYVGYALRVKNTYIYFSA